MKRFTNKLNMDMLKTAIANWVICAGNMNTIIDVIPYSDEMCKVIPWTDERVCVAICDAVGERPMARIKSNEFHSIGDMSTWYNRFYIAVENIAERVYKTYDTIIAMLNEEYEKSNIIKHLDVGTYLVNINKNACDHGKIYRVCENLRNGGFRAYDLDTNCTVVFSDGINREYFTIVPK